MNHRTRLITFLVLSLSTFAGAGELPTAEPDAVGLSPAKLDQLKPALQKLVDDGKLPAGVIMTQVLPTNHGGTDGVFHEVVRAAVANSAGEPVYPARISQDHRYFVDQQGRPVFWLGTTQWQLFREYSLDDARTIIEKSKQKGFAPASKVPNTGSTSLRSGSAGKRTTRTSPGLITPMGTMIAGVCCRPGSRLSTPPAPRSLAS